MFVNALQGQSINLTRAIRSLPGVQQADAITGDYDIVAAVTAKDLAELRDIMAGVQGLRRPQDHDLHGARRLKVAEPLVGGELDNRVPLAAT